MKFVLVLLCCCLTSAARAADGAPAQSSSDVWETLLKPHYFAAAAIAEDDDVITLDAPYRAEDAAFTPLRIRAMMPQTPQRYIRTIQLFVDHNPEPAVGTFEFSPASASADLALRVRIDKYSYVRAVAELNDGSRHMAKRFVKAQGGCAIPVAIDYGKAMQDLGRVRLRTLAAHDADAAIATQLQVRHPNFSGMQMDYRIYAVRPAHYVKHLRVLLDGQLVLDAETGIAVSADPSFRFFLRPHSSGVLSAEITDSKGNRWQQELQL